MKWHAFSFSERVVLECLGIALGLGDKLGKVAAALKPMFEEERIGNNNEGF